MLINQITSDSFLRLWKTGGSFYVHCAENDQLTDVCACINLVKINVCCHSLLPSSQNQRTTVLVEIWMCCFGRSHSCTMLATPETYIAKIIWFQQYKTLSCGNSCDIALIIAFSLSTTMHRRSGKVVIFHTKPGLSYAISQRLKRES